MSCCTIYISLRRVNFWLNFANNCFVNICFYLNLLITDFMKEVISFASTIFVQLVKNYLMKISTEVFKRFLRLHTSNYIYTDYWCFLSHIFLIFLLMCMVSMGLISPYMLLPVIFKLSNI